MVKRATELFNNQEFFRCHEVLEEVWTREQGPRRLFLQAVIHLAVGLYHFQRRNRQGASGQLCKGLTKLQPYLPAFDGIDTNRLCIAARIALNQIEAGASEIDFPRIDAEV